MATNNTVQYTITAKDQASAVFAGVSKTAKGVGTGIAEAAVMAGAAMYKMSGTVKDGFGVLTGNFSKLGSLMGAIPGPIGVVGQAVGDALGGMIQRTIDTTIAFDKLSQATGASVEFLSGFTEAADDVRVKSETVSAALSIFSKKLGGVEDAMDGSGQTAGAFAQKLKDLGITTDNMEEALFQVADVFKEMPNGVDKAALAVSLFGKQGAALIPILNKGRDGIKEMMQGAKETGKVIDQELRDKVIKLAEAQDKLNDSWGGIETRMGAELIPAFLNVTEGVNKYIVAVGKANKDTPILERFFMGLNASVNLFDTGALAHLNGSFAEFGGKIGAIARDMGGGGQLSAGIGSIGKAFGELVNPVKSAAGVMGDWSAAAGDIAGRIASSVGPLKDYASAMTTTATPTNDFKDSIAGVNSGLGLLPEKLSKAQGAAALYRLAVGDVSFETWSADRATRAVTQALTDMQITKPQAVAMWQEIRDKTTPIPDIMGRIGQSGKDAMTDIGNMGAALGKINSKEVTLTFDAQQTQNFIDANGRYASTTDKNVTVSINYSDNDPFGGNARAKGGPVKKSKPYLVGEQGPEMFVPYTSGYIVPNSAPYTDPGTKVNQSFSVNNPSIIINSVNGAAIAQQIARQNSNVVRRARLGASLRG